MRGIAFAMYSFRLRDLALVVKKVCAHEKKGFSSWWKRFTLTSVKVARELKASKKAVRDHT